MRVIKNSFFEFHYTITNNCIFIDLLEVYPEFRGQGCGSGFIRKFIEEHEHYQLPIHALVIDPGVRGFWLKLGFVESRFDYNTLIYRRHINARR